MNPYLTYVARAIPFDPTVPVPNFTSTNVQDAIAESKSSAVATVRFTIVTLFNAIVNNNQWLGYSDQLPGDTTPIVLTRNCFLKEISTSFIGASVDGRIDYYKNGTLVGNIIDNTTFVYTNENAVKIFTGLGLMFNSGDQLRGRWVDTGENPQDLSILYSFEVIP